MADQDDAPTFPRRPDRTERVDVRVTAEEKLRLRVLAARETNGDVSAFVRLKTLGAAPDAEDGA